MGYTIDEFNYFQKKLQNTNPAIIASDLPLINTHWKLVELDGKKIP